MQHSYLKLFHRFLKRSDFKETRVSWQNLSQSSPDFGEDQHFSFWCFAPLNPKERIWPLFGDAPFLKEKPLVCAGRASISTPACAWWKSLVMLITVQKMHHKFLFKRRMKFEWECLQKSNFEKLQLTRSKLCLRHRSFFPDLYTCRGVWKAEMKLIFEIFLQTSF